MAVNVIHMEARKKIIYAALEADTWPDPAGGTYEIIYGGFVASELWIIDNGDRYIWHGDAWYKTHSNGSIKTFPTDFYTEVQKGNVPGHSMVNKFGRAPTSSSGTEQSVSDLGLMQFPGAAATMRVKAGGNAADTAAGAGAREITIYGLDETGALAEEAVATAGASASAATTTTFLRVFRARVTQAGTYITTSIDVTGDNQAAVTIEDSGGVADYLRIPAHEGTTEYAGYHVGLGTTAYLIDAHMNVDALKSADVILYQRRDILDSTAPVQSRRVVHYADGVAGGISVDFKGPVSFPALTDIWWNFIPSANGTECSVSFELLIVDD